MAIDTMTSKKITDVGARSESHESTAAEHTDLCTPAPTNDDLGRTCLSEMQAAAPVPAD